MAEPKVPTVQIVAVGTELVLGRIQDTNSFWLSQQLSELGAEVRRITVIPDTFDEVIPVLQGAADDGTEFVVVTGGLGPTPDDLTVEAFAKLLNEGTYQDRSLLEDYMRRRQIGEDELSDGLRKMATVPESAVVWASPAGWAPCIQVKKAKTTYFVLPGPPREMEALFDRYVATAISESLEIRSAARRVFVNMSESEVSPLIEVAMEQLPGLYAKAYVALRTDTHMPVDFVARASSDREARGMLSDAIDQFSLGVKALGKDIHY
ncbi:MAG: competence/damage-inducible protein A [Chloroflexi bacterium]|nr:competence/damage-inducible protein A [Chloroflexota bacterium]